MFVVLFSQQAQAKFSIERAREALYWVEAVLQQPLPFPSPDEGLRDQFDFAHVLKDGIILCEYVYSHMGHFSLFIPH